MNADGRVRSVHKQMKGSLKCVPITDPTLVDLCLKLDKLGYSVDNQQEGVIFKQKEWRLYFSKGTEQFHCYWCGFGHCAVFCSLLDFRDADHIILWQEEQKSMTLTEPPIVRLGTPGNW